MGGLGGGGGGGTSPSALVYPTSKSRGLSPPIKVNELLFLSLTQLIVLSHELLIYLAIINNCEPICCQNAPECARIDIGRWKSPNFPGGLIPPGCDL